MLNVAGLDFPPDQAESPGPFGHAVDQSIDDTRIKNQGKPTRTRGKRPHDDKIIEFIDIVLVEEKAVGPAPSEGREMPRKLPFPAIGKIGQQNSQRDDGKG